MYSYGPPHMAVQKQDDQLELTYSSYVKTQDVTLKTCRRRWVIGRSGERGPGISVLTARHDEDDDDDLSTYYIVYTRFIVSIYMSVWNLYLTLLNSIELFSYLSIYFSVWTDFSTPISLLHCFYDRFFGNLSPPLSLSLSLSLSLQGSEAELGIF